MATVMLKAKGSEEIIRFVDKLTEKKRMSPEEVAAEIKREKNESVYWFFGPNEFEF